MIRLTPDIEKEEEERCHAMLDAWYLCRPIPPDNQQILSTRFYGDLGIVIEISKYQERDRWTYQIISAAYYEHRTGDEFLAVKGWCRVFDREDSAQNERDAIQFTHNILTGQANPRHYFGNRLPLDYCSIYTTE